ncbi:MAG: glycosyltransferase family 87 protein [Vicinamibacterales bacterium]
MPRQTQALISRDEVAILALCNGIVLILVGLLRHFDTRDFDVFYASARQLTAGQSPYAGIGSLNTNPPHLVAFMALFAQWPLSVAYWAWTAMSAAALGWAVHAIMRARRLSLDLPVCAGLLNGGTFSQLAGGQVAWILAGPMTFAWLAGDTLVAGLLVGLCASVKPFVALFLLFLLWRRQWRAATGMVMALVSVGVVGIGLLGLPMYREWALTLAHLNTPHHPGNGALFGLVARVMQPGALQWITPDAGYRIWACAVLLALGVGAMGVRGATRDAQWAIVLVTALLISPLGQAYYLALAVGPLWATLRLARWPRWSIGLIGFCWWPNLLTTPEPPTAVWQLLPYGFTCAAILTLWALLIYCDRVGASVRPRPDQSVHRAADGVDRRQQTFKRDWFGDAGDGV